MPAIKLKDLSFSHSGSEETALKNINVEINKGEFVAIIGANNSGKSSLCYALTGVIPHLYRGKMQGSICINNQDTKTKSVPEISNEAGLVMNIPKNQLSGVRYTVFEEVAFSLENRGIEREEMKQQVAQTLKKIGIEELADRCPQHLSGGQQQKVVLASVLANNPEILVLDEPTTFLDPQGTRQVFEILHQLQQSGKTIVIAEQNMELIAMYADRVIALHDGEMILDGTPSAVLTDSKLQQIGMDSLRYTKVSELAAQKGLWQESKSPAITLEATIEGLKIDRL
ncbi:ABC transporter ATP-binding protein [Maridesulfovibrio sp.]|uniref:energy-coupling factor ABC transporter ATP-binding protein n=1 Tax=Maridesulfovibrio sp. TaxID=2795000 RepID=UPI0029CA1EA9|nr:ABC transporter ATP-binding protein [Maridesulfovibrio sp.]